MEIDGLICLTDGGDCYNDCFKPKKFPVLWALTQGGENCLPYTWGQRTKIEIKKKRT